MTMIVLANIDSFVERWAMAIQRFQDPLCIILLICRMTSCINVCLV